jgi:tetratricopeptide (TPR) repeat protein
MFARGLLHQFAGNGDSAYYWFRAVVRAAPDWSEGWYGVGEAAFHLWPRGDNLDSVARDAFQRSVDLDPDFAPVVFHLAELTIIAGNLDTAARLVERHRQLGEDPVQQLELDVMLRCLRRGADAVDWGAIASAEKAADQVLIAGRLLSAGGRHLTCAEAAYRAALLSPAPDEDLSRRWNAALGLHHLFVARGEHERAIRLADSLVTGGIPAGRGLRILDAILAVGPDSAGAAEIAALAMPLDSSSLARLWWFGEWAAHMRDTTRLAAVAAQLDRRAAFSARLGDSLVARLMRARLILFRGDTAAAIDSLRALRAVDPLPSQVWRYWEALAPERLLLARLLLARGRPEEALRVAETFDGQRTVVDLAFLPQSLELRADAAERLGDRDRGAEYRRRLGAMRGR